MNNMFLLYIFFKKGKKCKNSKLFCSSVAGVHSMGLRAVVLSQLKKRANEELPRATDNVPHGKSACGLLKVK